MTAKWSFYSMIAYFMSVITINYIPEIDMSYYHPKHKAMFKEAYAALIVAGKQYNKMK